ncbi:MAG: malto-oligosyltrehalose trehalohydrolase, partial [bacterium]|nr:malto-oligosyltrehalose trehalohydrolase [bacterium]
MLDGDRGVRYRLWAPSAKSLSLVVASDGDRKVRMQRTADGWFECVDLHSRAGTRYWYELDDDARVPDPAARFMPHGPHAPSEVVDPASFAWQPGTETCVRPQREYVFYELHVGTFTPEGTFAAAASHLEYLAELGVTAIELMPVAQAAGSKNWGYDGVGFYAPSCAYGRPDDLKAFVARAHVLGLCVILDVVYNHFGPEGNYLHRYAPSFFDERCPTPWGPALDLTSRSNEPARAYIIENACYWLAEYRFDGLRLDAVSALHEDARRPLLEQLSVRAREAAGRPAFIAIEHEHLDPELVSNEKAPCDAAWSDEVHHSLHTAISSERDGYYREYAARPIARLGRALAEERSRFVQCLQNHDHIGNRPFGERITA